MEGVLVLCRPSPQASRAMMARLRLRSSRVMKGCRPTVCMIEMIADVICSTASMRTMLPQHIERDEMPALGL